MQKITGVLFLFFFTVTASAQLPAYKNAALPIEERVTDLLQRMTPEEKFWQLFMIPGDLDNATPQQFQHGLFGFQVSAATKSEGASQQLLQYNTKENAVLLATKINSLQKYFTQKTRLGIPLLIFDEALHGLVREGATAFPQAIGLAASFDTVLMHRVAKAIAAESRQRGIRQILSPVVNIASDVRWGRTEETYGEDPYLCSAMAVAYVSELEKAGIISTPKHFLANVGDGGRDSYPIHWNERLLKEIYLPPFKACFEWGGSRSVMTAYNSIDGSPATASKWLLQDLLKKEYGFNGFVISDASAVGGANVLHYTASDYADAGKRALQNGLDVIFQTQYEHYKLFIPPFLNDSISKERIDDAVRRVLRAKFQLGLFENPFVPIIDNTQQQQEHRMLAQEAAEKSFVLLKNNNSILPLGKNIKRIAVLGEEAIAGRLGGYSGPGNNIVSVLQGLQNIAGKQYYIQFAKGAGRNYAAFNTISNNFLFTNERLTEKGLKAAYYKTVNFTGTPTIQTDAQIDFKWTLYGPAAVNTNSFYSVEWNGYLLPPATGNFKIGLQGNDGYRLYINNQLVVDQWSKQSFHTNTVAIALQKNKAVPIRIQFYEPVGNAQLQLIWNAVTKDSSEVEIQKAVALLKQSDIAIVVAGITEGEFQDRASLQLPGKQEAVIHAVAATGKPVVVIIVGGSAVVMNNWIDKVAAVLQIWYPGEAGGNAVANTLLGYNNPAGRLPISFPIDEAQLPLVYNHKPTGRGDDYNNLSGQPLFPFGYGLSYTNFSYSNLQLNKTMLNKTDSVLVSCTISNTGAVAGDEVVQLYLHDELATVARPVMELKGFQRIHLAAGATTTVSFWLKPNDFKLYNEQMEWVTEPGAFKIMMGASSREIRLQTMVTIK